MSSLKPISQEVQESPQLSMIYVCSAQSFLDCLIACSREIYPSDNIIRVVQKSHGEHQVKMSEVACRGSQCNSLVCIAQTAHDCGCMVS